MLTVKRLVTAGICFVLLFVVLFFGSLVVCGAVVGGMAGAKNPDNAAQAGREAGEEFGRNYGGIILLASVGLAGMSSGILTFGGVLPWCRRKEHPTNPENPGVNRQVDV